MHNLAQFSETRLMEIFSFLERVCLLITVFSHSVISISSVSHSVRLQTYIKHYAKCFGINQSKSVFCILNYLFNDRRGRRMGGCWEGVGILLAVEVVATAHTYVIVVALLLIISISTSTFLELCRLVG